MAVITRNPICEATPRPYGRRGCMGLDHPLVLPDLATYSQEEQFALGNVPSWESPDISTTDWVLQAGLKLILDGADGLFRFEKCDVLVRNLSPTAGACDVIVTLYSSDFGLGTPRTAQGSQIVSLGPGEERWVAYPLLGDFLKATYTYGAHVEIQHPFDSNLINNRASQTVAGVFTSRVGRAASLRFPVANPSGQPLQVQLSTLINELGAVVSPAALTLLPGQQQIATLAYTVPDTFHGSPSSPVEKNVTVVMREAAGRLIDGLTYMFRVDD